MSLSMVNTEKFYPATWSLPFFSVAQTMSLNKSHSPTSLVESSRQIGPKWRGRVSVGVSVSVSGRYDVTGRRDVAADVTGRRDVAADVTVGPAVTSGGGPG